MSAVAPSAAVSRTRVSAYSVSVGPCATVNLSTHPASRSGGTVTHRPPPAAGLAGKSRRGREQALAARLDAHGAQGRVAVGGDHALVHARAGAAVRPADEHHAPTVHLDVHEVEQVAV